MNPKKNTKRSAELEEELSRLPGEERLEFMQAWELVGKAEKHIDDAPELDDAWTDLQSRIQVSARPRISRRDRRARRSSALRRRSLVFGGVLLAGAVIFLWIWQLPLTAVAPAGALNAVTLADGSTVHLNSGTRLRYRARTLPGASDRLRSVELDGEAFFEIAPAEQPFIVETPAAVIEVLGTRFNVRARMEQGDLGTEVTLASGHVRVRGRHSSDRPVRLTRPGEKVHIALTAGADFSLDTDTTTLDYVLAWRRDAFAAIDRPVVSIVAEIERRYALTIQVEDDEALQSSMTLLYGPGTRAERILHDICLVQGCRYRPTSRGFAIFMPNKDANKL